MTVNLCDSVYSSSSVAAAAVAAHECGHAVQHARGYAPLTLRSQLVPVVQFASTAATWVIILGLVILASTQNELLCWIGVGMIAMSALFSLVTLPVEYNASARAVEWLQTSRTMQGSTARAGQRGPLVGGPHLPRSGVERHRVGALLRLHESSDGATDPPMNTPGKDYTHHSWLAAAALIAVLVAVSFIPPQSVGA